MDNTDCLIVNGGIPLNGDVFISGSKNASLPLIACSLLTYDTVSLNNIPLIDDIFKMKSILQHLGAQVEDKLCIYNNNKCIKLIINCSNLTSFEAPLELSNQLRASYYLLGPLLARYGECILPIPGGCFSDKRPIDLHISVLEKMGANIEIKDGVVHAKCKYGKLYGIRFYFDKVSVGATINALMAATLAIGETYLENCAREPEVIDLCKCLKRMGAHLEFVGERNLKIIGKECLSGVDYTVIADRIEAGTFMIAAVISQGDITINGIEYGLVENIAVKLIEANVEIKQLNESSFNVKCESLKNLKPIEITTNTHPLPIPTDIQPIFMTLTTLIKGTSTIVENIFKHRFSILSELNKMGANVKIFGENSVKVHGVDGLYGECVNSTDLRAAAALVLAGIAAIGVTRVYGLKYLDRGYQSFENKLIACGANIYRISKQL